MQLIDTHVGETSDGMVAVEFRGEGGELVSVRMAARNIGGDAAVARAKELMVQLTTFADVGDVSLEQAHEETGEGSDDGRREKEPELPIVSSFGDAASASVSNA